MPSLKNLPELRSHVTVARHFGKKAFLEVYERPDRKLRDWFLFEGEGEPCVVIFALTKNRGKLGYHVVTVKHFRYGAREVIHELPGGGVKKGQTLEEAVQAELKEETGYQADSKRIQKLGEPLWFEPAAVRAQFQPMLALDVSEAGDPEPEEDEFLEPELMPVSKWFGLIASGKVTDAKSIAVSILAIQKLPVNVQNMVVKSLRP